MTRILIRPSTADDLPTVTAIYAWHVRHGTGTFELEAPAADEMGRRHQEVIDKGLQKYASEGALIRQFQTIMAAKTG